MSFLVGKTNQQKFEKSLTTEEVREDTLSKSRSYKNHAPPSEVIESPEVETPHRCIHQATQAQACLERLGSEKKGWLVDECFVFEMLCVGFVVVVGSQFRRVQGVWVMALEGFLKQFSSSLGRF